ncbi:APH(3') family aminoglycoside O-phosphotransferase [Stenotrophomonas rhizophila]
MWHQRLAGCRIEAQAIGASRADVFRAHGGDGPDVFLKREPADDPFGELQDEVARLRWLQGQGVEAAQVLDTHDDANGRWLLMRAVPGRDLASSPDLAPLQVVHLMADALQALHRLPTDRCPFDHRLPHRLAAARARMGAGVVDAEDFDDARAGQTVQQVFAALLTSVPTRADLVVTHGDACLPNLMAAQGRFTGFIDCGRLGVADRHQDLALAARSIASNLGDSGLRPSLRATAPCRIPRYWPSTVCSTSSSKPAHLTHRQVHGPAT